MRRVTVVFLGTLLVAFIVCVSQAQGQSPYPHTGYTLPSGPGYSDAQIDAALDVLQKNGIEYIHGDIWWFLVHSQVELPDGSKQDKFDFTPYDNFFRRVKSHGLKVYLILGSGVDGSTSQMPSFLFPPGAWLFDQGLDPNNSIKWYPYPADSNILTFDYSTTWLWLTWTPAVALKYDILPGEETSYLIRARSISGSTRISFGYNILARSDNHWVGSFDHVADVELSGPDWQEYDIPLPGGPPLVAPDPGPGNYLQLKIGAVSGSASEFEVDLNGFEFALPGRGLDVGASAFPIADKTKIRASYDPCWKQKKPVPFPVAPLDEGAGYLAIFTDQQFQKEEETFFRAAIHNIETQDYADTIVAYGPNNEPFVGSDTMVDYSETNRKAFADWLKKDLDSVEIPKRPCGATLDRTEFVKSGSTPEAWLDFDKFMREQYSFGYLNSRLSIIKDQLRKENKQKKTFLKFPPEAIDWGSLMEDNSARLAASPYLDILGLDLYSYQVGHTNRQDPASVRAAFAGMATIAHRYGKLWGITEFGAGIPDHVSAEMDDAVRYAAAYGPAVIFPFNFIYFDDSRLKPGFYSGYYKLDSGPIEPFLTDVSRALKEVAGKTAQSPDADVAVLYSVYDKTYFLHWWQHNVAQDMKNALADLGLRTTVLYTYEVQKNPQLLSSFAAVVVPSLMIARENCDDLSVLTTLNDYVRQGGKLIIAGPYDRVTAKLEDISTCSRGTNEVLYALPAAIEKFVLPGDPQHESSIQFPKGNFPDFPWTKRWILVDSIGNVEGLQDAQVWLRLNSGAVELASYAGSGEPAIVMSKPNPQRAFGNVIVVGPRLRFVSGDLNGDGMVDNVDKALLQIDRLWGQDGYDRYWDYNDDFRITYADDPKHPYKEINTWAKLFSDSEDNFSLTQFFQRIFANWGLMPVKIEQGNGVIAHLGADAISAPDGISIANNSDSASDFRVRLPFKVLPTDVGDKGYFPSYPNPGYLLQGRLNSRQAVFIRLNRKSNCCKWILPE